MIWKGLWRNRQVWVWGALIGLALVLRGYHLTGFVLNQDEGHWLYYSLEKRLLLEQERNSYPRPDALFPVMLTGPIALFGPNELAMRILPVIFGAFSVVPMALLVRRLTGRAGMGEMAAVILAGLPLHIYLSAQGIPEVIALFFTLCALERFAWAAEEATRTRFVAFGCWLALSLLAKVTALAFLVLLVVIAPAFLRAGRQRRNFYGAIMASLVPLLAMLVAIKSKGEALTFFQEPVALRDIHLEWGRIITQVNLAAGFYEVSLLAAVIGAVVVVRFHRRLLLFLLPLAMLSVTPFFRVSIKELLWISPTVCLFAAYAIGSLPRGKALVSTTTAVILLGHACCLSSFPWPPGARSAADRTSAIVDRPPGWPSRQTTRWLLEHTTAEDGILIAMFTFRDPLYLELRGQHRRIMDSWENWELLRDPANRIKYAVFVDDYQDYAPLFAKFADTHFSKPGGADSANYTIYDCQKEGRFAAYPGAMNSADSYVRRGKALSRQKDFAAAVVALETALELDPDSLSARSELMPAYIVVGRKEEALRVGEEVLKVNPQERQTNFNLALLHLELGHIREGVEQCEKNIRLGISPAISYGVLGQLLEKKGEVAAAVTAYEKSLALDPHNPVTQNLLANLQRKMSQPIPAP